MRSTASTNDWLGFSSRSIKARASISKVSPAIFPGSALSFSGFISVNLAPRFKEAAFLRFSTMCITNSPFLLFKQADFPILDY